MNTTSHFIADRAQSLVYEAIQFPSTAETALAWLHRAVAYAEGKGMTVLADELGFAVTRIEDHYEALMSPLFDHLAAAAQTIDAMPAWAGEGEV
ncbi:hypothetical protein LJC59_00095 [Desulfovibrio sp. OttesenSCG-928-A18]|nr:hypothetical protein [Desulfovibrio sp. OttesenSCG-928-A18]